MATNPMKRREHNALLIGIILGLLVTLVVGFILYNMYSKTKKEFDQYKADQVAKQKEVVVAVDEIKSGSELSEDMFKTAIVSIDMDTSDCFTSISDVFYVGEDKDGNTLESEFSARLDIPAGAIITKNLIQENDGHEIVNDTRVREYSSFVLPSQLEEGDFVDIRLTMPSGQDFIVLSKKLVLQADETTVWFNMSEAEMLILNSAMVEAWTITGTKLYAVQYADAGMQQSATITYQPTAEVTSLIETNPNIIDDAAKNLAQQWRDADAARYRTDYIDAILYDYRDNRDGAAESGFAEETSNIRAHRSEYIDSLGN